MNNGITGRKCESHSVNFEHISNLFLVFLATKFYKFGNTQTISDNKVVGFIFASSFSSPPSSHSKCLTTQTEIEKLMQEVFIIMLLEISAFV